MRTPHLIACALIVSALSLPAFAADPVNDADKTFTGKISQQSLYEEAISRWTETHALLDATKSMARKNVLEYRHAHAHLVEVSAKQGVPVSSRLDGEYRIRLNQFKSIPAEKLDTAYVDDMQKLRTEDQKLYSDEAQGGSAEYKSYAQGMGQPAR